MNDGAGGPGARPEELIVERLDGETLVYDTASDEAHCLDPVVAAEFEAADSDVSRRQVIRRLALAGAAASGGAVLVRSIVAPAPAQAQSVPVCTPACPVTHFCCAGNPNFCCANGSPCVGGSCFD